MQGLPRFSAAPQMFTKAPRSQGSIRELARCRVRGAVANTTLTSNSSCKFSAHMPASRGQKHARQSPETWSQDTDE